MYLLHYVALYVLYILIALSSSDQCLYRSTFEEISSYLSLPRVHLQYKNSPNSTFKISAPLLFLSNRQSTAIERNQLILNVVEIMHAEVNTDVAWLIDRNVEAATTGVHFNRDDRGDDLNDGWRKINQRSNDFPGNYSQPSRGDAIDLERSEKRLTSQTSRFSSIFPLFGYFNLPADE